MTRPTAQLRRYLRYAFDLGGFDTRAGVPQPSPAALAAAQAARGADHPPALLIHGIMKRAGTVYTGHLLALHPDVTGFPQQLWETPLLARAGDVRALTGRFLDDYRPNYDRFPPHDLLPLLGAGFMAYLHAATPPGQRALTKIPSVEYLHHFFAMFPHEQLLLVVRDGRDVVHSTVNTWQGLPFHDVCRRWQRSAAMVNYVAHHFADHPNFLLTRYETVIADPAAFVRRVCDRFGLDVDRYPFDAIADIPLQGSSTVKRADGRARYWVNKPADFNPVGRWQNWSRWRKLVFKRLAGQALIDLGYAPDHNW